MTARTDVALERPAPASGWAEKRWTAEEFLRPVEVGILREGRGPELIDGKIIYMASMRTPHYRCSVKSTAALNRRLGEDYVVIQQLPISLSTYSEPEPDVYVVRGTLDTLLATKSIVQRA